MKYRILLWALLFITVVFSGVAETIWISTDLHLSDSGTMQALAYEQLLGRVQKGDVLILLGDLANSGHVKEHESVLKGLDQIKSKAAVYVLPGNHDLTVETPPDMFRTLYSGYGYDQAFACDTDSLSYVAMTPDGTCLLMLDTNCWEADKKAVMHGQIGAHLPEWVHGVLSGLPTGTPVLACGHYPLFPLEGTDATDHAFELVKILSDDKVLAYLCGHRHSNDTFSGAGLRQITVGVPWSYPAYAGCVSLSEGGCLYTVQALFDAEDQTGTALKQASVELAERMATGSLAGTSFEDDAAATEWFLRFFMAVLEGTLPDQIKELHADEGYFHWEQAEVRSAVKPWILSTMASLPEDYHSIQLR
ncbi:MAG: metallophosphoesterase [Clostridia bacterium]|nr:metallophosphoesterase [Clostridia bacterium]